jgi:hypothetical protein
VGLGLYLRATPQVANPLEVVEHHLKAHCREVLDSLDVEEGRLSASLHPAAEAVEFAHEGPFLTVEAKTSSVGPGYHAYLCEQLHSLEEKLGASFGDGPDGNEEGAGDETGYFMTGDRAALEQEMLAWLGGVAGMVTELIPEGTTGLMISMGTDLVFEFDGEIATPLGPRTAEWLEATRRDPRAGIDIFPWWGPGLCADHAAGRALVRMWSDLAWRNPANDGELALIEKIETDLRRAHELDATRALPWAEWAAILEFLGRDDAVARRVRERAAGASQSVGYRRRPMRVTLTDGWSIRVPGETASSFDEDGTWCGLVEGRTIWMSSFRVGDPDSPTRSAAETLPDEEPSGDRFELSPFPEGYAGRAELGTTEEGDVQLTVEVARPHRLALFTFVLDDEADLQWAREVAASVR